MDKIYIIPGLGENCDESQYKDLIAKIRPKNKIIVPINPDWYPDWYIELLAMNGRARVDVCTALIIETMTAKINI